MDLIYDAAVDPGRWVEVMRRLAALTGGGPSVLTQLDLDTGRGSVELTDYDAGVVAAFFDHYHSVNPLHLVPDSRAYIADWDLRVLLHEQIVSAEELQKSEYYNDYLRPLSAEHGMIVRLGLSGRQVSAISIGRSFRRGQFSEAETATAVRLQPHLVRAFAVAEKLGELTGVNAGLAAALDRASPAMLIVDADAGIRHANVAAERLLARGDVLQGNARRLKATTPLLTTRLRELIARAAVQDWSRRSAGSLQLPAFKQDLPVTVTASPLAPEQTSSVRSSSPVVLVVVTETTRAAELSPALLAERYGATGAESRLAFALLAGLSLQEAAARHVTSIHTARNQLASLFSKTGTRRQSELIRLLMSESSASADG